ncbi:MAG: response regulator transcription factor [Acidimicrobiales bacterium]|jgi:DNA-binding NarL/FixJ family response regulator|nr:response regulator transcription factor [Acidimicrobiales bacterium]MDP6901463.1 response regulator transcription factor [Acidimicrobiales bacterium]
MPNSEPTRVVLVDDHEIVRKGLSDLLETEHEFQVVAAIGSIKEALPLLRGLRPHIAVIDVQLPDGNGIDLVKRVTQDLPEVSCVVLTSFGDDALLVDALDAGAAAFLVKEIRSLELTNTLRRVAAGEPIFSEAQRTEEIQRAQTRIAARDGTATLSPQELKIFELIGQGFTNRQIGQELFIAEKTVKNYITSLFSKLGIRRRSEAAALAARREEKLWKRSP